MFLAVCNIGPFFSSASASGSLRIAGESHANWLHDRSMMSRISGPSGQLSPHLFTKAISYLIPMGAALNLSPEIFLSTVSDFYHFFTFPFSPFFRILRKREKNLPSLPKLASPHELWCHFLPFSVGPGSIIHLLSPLFNCFPTAGSFLPSVNMLQHFGEMPCAGVVLR